MNLKDALAKVDDLLPALEKLLAPDAMLAFRTVYDAAHGSAVADVLGEVNRTSAATNLVRRPHHYIHSFNGKCRLCLRLREDPLHDPERERSTATPRDHEIHPNRGTP